MSENVRMKKEYNCYASAEIHCTFAFFIDKICIL